MTGASGNNNGTGVLGPDNIAVPSPTSSSTASASAAPAGSSTSDSVTKNNAINKTTESDTIPAGVLKKQAISVAVDATAAKSLDAATLNDLISTAAGVDRNRGDTVAVKIIPFSTAQADAAKAALAAAKAEADGAAAQKFWTNLGLGAGVLVLVLAALVFYALRNRRQKRQPVDLGESPDAMLQIDPLPLAPAPTTALPYIPEPAALPAMETTDADGRRNSIDALAKADPEKTAQLMRALMEEKVGA